jgi:hypothetical protein
MKIVTSLKKFKNLGLMVFLFLENKNLIGKTSSEFFDLKKNQKPKVLSKIKESSID